MAEQLNRHNDATGLVQSAKRAGTANYLGDREVVDRIVRDFAAGVLARFEQVGDGRLTPDEAAEQDKAVCHDMALIFAGRDDHYAIQPGWNDGALAMYVRNRLKEAIQPEDDLSVMAQAFAMLVHVIYDELRTGGTDAAKLTAEINEAVRSFSWLLLGIEEHD